MAKAQEPRQIIDIPELNNEQGAAQMELSTRKYSNGQIVSAAHIHYAKDGMMVFELYGDFSKTMLRIKGRATQKTLDAQQAQAFTPESIAALRVEVLAFYASKRKREALAA
jgi:hypothetical protein